MATVPSYPIAHGVVILMKFRLRRKVFMMIKNYKAGMHTLY